MSIAQPTLEDVWKLFQESDKKIKENNEKLTQEISRVSREVERVNKELSIEVEKVSTSVGRLSNRLGQNLLKKWFILLLCVCSKNVALRFTRSYTHKKVMGAVTGMVIFPALRF